MGQSFMCPSMWTLTVKGVSKRSTEPPTEVRRSKVQESGYFNALLKNLLPPALYGIRANICNVCLLHPAWPQECKAALIGHLLSCYDL